MTRAGRNSDTGARWQSVWTRLFLSFLAIIGLTSAASITAFLFFVGAREDLREIAERRMPEVVLANQLAEAGGEFISLSTAILTIEDENEARDLRGEAVAISLRIEKLVDRIAAEGTAEHAGLLEHSRELRDSLTVLRSAAGSALSARRPHSSNPEAPGRTGIVRASMAGSETSC